MDLPIENGGSFHSYVSLPEGMYITVAEKWGLITMMRWLIWGEIFRDSPADFSVTLGFMKKNDMENGRQTKQHDLQMLGVPYLC